MHFSAVIPSVGVFGCGYVWPGSLSKLDSVLTDEEDDEGEPHSQSKGQHRRSEDQPPRQTPALPRGQAPNSGICNTSTHAHHRESLQSFY